MGFFLHGLACIALAAAMGRIRTGLFWPSFAIFFIHPVAGEQAMWISGRSASLVMGLGGLALYLALGGRLLAAAVLVFLASLAREDGVVFFVLLPLFVTKDRRRWLVYAICFFSAAILLRYLVLGDKFLPNSGGPVDASGLWLRLTDAASAFGHSVKMLFLLQEPVLMSFRLPSAGVFSIVLPVLVLATLVLMVRKRVLAWKAGLWLLMAFLPLSHLFHRGVGVAGRYAFVLLPGLILLAQSSARLRALPKSFLLFLLILLPFGAKQIWVLADARRIYSQALEFEENNPKASLLLALAHEQHGDRDLATRELWQLQKRYPRYSKAGVNLGRILFAVGRQEEGVKVLEAICSLEGASANAWLTLGRLYYEQKKYRAAAEAFDDCLAINPRQAQAARYQCRAFIKDKDFDAARDAFQAAKKLSPEDPSLHDIEKMLEEHSAR